MYRNPDSPYQISIEFIDNLSTEQVVAIISELSNPQVITWYIGCHGLRNAGVKFYKNSLISPILRSHENVTFWLVDLTAWGAFKKPQYSILSYHSACEAIETISIGQIKCIKSADIFTKMQKITEIELVHYFKRSLRRSFISQSSKHFPNSNIRIRDIFFDSCPIVSDWYDYDANKVYSVLQYLEGCLLVDEIFAQQTANNSNEIQIVFALPNDELKYYRDANNSFQTDIKFLIAKRCATLKVEKICLQVKFLAFKYGAAQQDRPYNAAGKTIKSGSLSFNDIVGDLSNKEKTSTREEAVCILS